MNVGYTRAAADSLSVEFPLSAPPEPVIQALADAVVEHGISFMKSGCWQDNRATRVVRL
jgi:hypothetical protein